MTCPNCGHQYLLWRSTLRDTFPNGNFTKLYETIDMDNYCAKCYARIREFTEIEFDNPYDFDGQVVSRKVELVDVPSWFRKQLRRIEMKLMWLGV